MSQPSAAASSRGLTQLFADRKIATKIAIGFGLIFAIIIAISGISFPCSGEDPRRNFHDYAARVNNGSIVAEIDRHFLAMGAMSVTPPTSWKTVSRRPRRSASRSRS